MERHPELVLMGQDIAEYGGAFKITDGFVEQFGKDRVRNTPLCESAILGASLGLSIKGMKAMMEMQFADFVSEGITQICNNIKADNIEIYTVLFDVSDPDIRTRLKNCATEEKMSFNADKKEDLLAAFREIGNQRTYLKILK
jgi:hypothetical protein